MRNKIAVVVLLGLAIQQANAQGLSLGVPDSLNFDSITNSIKGDPKTSPQQDDIPGGSEGYLYQMGTGQIDRISMPPVSRVTKPYRASYSAGLGYSCGNFNPFSNVEQMINKVTSKFKKMPQQFVSAAQEAVAALPAYVMNKINPTLYNTITKNLDDSFDLFQTEFKSCEQWESEITNQSGTYFDYFKAASNEAMRDTIAKNQNDTIDDVRTKAKEKGAKDGIVGADGKRKGGEGQEAFSAMDEVIVAGYNMLLNRKASEKGQAGGTSPERLTQLFKKPEDLVTWATLIYGNRSFSVDAKKSAEGQSGIGFRYQYNAMRFNIMELLFKLYRNEITMEQFRKETGGIQFPRAELMDLQGLTKYAQDITIQQKSQREAILDMRMRLQVLKDVLLAGLEEPDLVQQSASGAVVKQDINMLIARITDDMYSLSALAEQG